jgi:hypothetical protein
MRGTILVVLVLFAASCAKVATHPTSTAQPAQDDAKQIAVDTYVYGYPLVTMEWTRRVMTNVAKPEGMRAPMGHVIRARTYPNASFRDVTAPNADTLYTTAWLDVGKEPVVLTLPASKGRYYLVPMLDGWTNVFQVPGTRTTGNGPQKYAITGPRWTGALPPGVTEYKSPTALVWILGRIYCTGTPQDYAATHAMQDQVTVVPLSAYGKPYTAPAGSVDSTIDMKTSVRDQVEGMDGPSYFALLATLMKENPAAAADSAMVARMARIGLVPGKDFDASKLDAATAQAVREAPKQGVQKTMASFGRSGTRENGWLYDTKTGIYGTDYVNRALITAIGLGANRPQDAVYPTSQVDAAGQPYTGTNRYVMHFAPGQMPPVEGFWSLTMYDDKYFFVDNPLNRYTLSARDKLIKNPDGSVDLYVQHDNPGRSKAANWLPAPSGRFILMMRLYYPRETSPSILDGSWKVPPVAKVAP